MEKWTDEDVQALLNIYAEENIQKEFESSARNAKVYQKISARLDELGIRHGAQRCREKIKKMKQDYKKIKDHNLVNGSSRRSGKWFERLDAILGHRGQETDCGHTKGCEDTRGRGDTRDCRDTRGRGDTRGCVDTRDCRDTSGCVDTRDCRDTKDCVSVLLEPLTEEEEEEEEETVSFTEDDQYSQLSFASPAAHSRPTCPPPTEPRPPGPRAGKRKRDGDVLKVMRQLEEEQMEALRQDYEQRERHFQLLLQHIKEEITVRQEEAARARRQQGEFQQGVLTLLTQLVHVLAGRNVPSSSSPPLD